MAEFIGFIFFRKRKSHLTIGVWLLFFGFLLLFLTPVSSGADSLPQSIGSLTLQKLQAGEEARQEIDRMHGKQLTFKEGLIGTYKGENGKGTLWVSVYDSEEGAAQDLKKMTQRIKTGDQKVFWHFREILIEGAPVYFVMGMGQAHYFFQKGVKVVWLAIDPVLAKEAVREVIGEIP